MRESRARTRLITLALIAAVVAIVGTALVLDSRRSGDEERFVGTDSAATTRIEEDHPGYTPWFTSVFTPGSPEVESGLFALQAALGGIALGYTVGVLKGRRRTEAEEPRGAEQSTEADKPVGADSSAGAADPAGAP